MADYNTGAAEFTSDTRIYVPVYEVPDEYVTTPSTGQNAEITANWPAEGAVDVDQKIISMTSANDTGGPGHRVYMEGIGDGSMTIKGESKYMLGSTMPLPGEFILGRGVGGAGFIPFRYYCNYSMGGVFTTHTVDPEAIPKDVYIVSKPGAELHDRSAFLAGLTMGLCGSGESVSASDGGDFAKGYLAGCGIRAKR